MYSAANREPGMFPAQRGNGMTAHEAAPEHNLTCRARPATVSRSLKFSVGEDDDLVAGQSCGICHLGIC